jgi:hypothetical protein
MVRLYHNPGTTCLSNTRSVLPGALGVALLILPFTAYAADMAGCDKGSDPYKNYACLDTVLGDSVFSRLMNYYKLEWGQAGAPVDPNAPPSRLEGWPETPQSTPPMPFTEWPYGGATSLGVTRTGSIDSPLMVAIANTDVGRTMSDLGIQIYGWVDPGGNFSTNTQRKPGGNAPIAYAYIPNTAQLDQAVIYVDRFPDTVQKDHIDWGFRLSAIYGENYRYTTAYGIASYQYLKYNAVNGYDFPMLYGELYIPFVADGLMIRAGRYISLPDIEAQLAPNNYMYTHSLTYAYDNYTNEGVLATLAVTKQLMVQFGISVGTEAAVTNIWNNVSNPNPGNPLYQGKGFAKDPGSVPTYTACVRYTWNDGNDNIYPCANGINGGQWGYNNLQWYGFTYYHKFNDRWHLSYEFYDEHQNGVPNATGAYYQANGLRGTPFGPPYITYNAPAAAHCGTATALRCNAYAIGTVAYLNYAPGPMDNISFRPEIYYDAQGQRTGTAATYWEVSLGWQHWLSPQVEMRPFIASSSASVSMSTTACWYSSRAGGLLGRMMGEVMQLLDGIQRRLLRPMRHAFDLGVCGFVV